MNNMNQKLNSLYESRWQALTESSGKKMAHPLLIRISDEYEKSPCKIMVVGQETDGWIGNFSNQQERKECDFIQQDYFDYLYNRVADMAFNSNHGKNYTSEKRLAKKRRRPFWNRSNFKFFQEKLKSKLGKENVSFIWNNLSKLGKAGGGKKSRGKVPKAIENIENDVLKNMHILELDILQPDAIIFNTGYVRDKVLMQRYSCSVEPIEGFDYKHLAKVRFGNQHHHIISLRTCHPNARGEYMSGRKERNNAIACEIISNL